MSMVREVSVRMRKKGDQMVCKWPDERSKAFVNLSRCVYCLHILHLLCFFFLLTFGAEGEGMI